jgi:hypothetical protein
MSENQAYLVVPIWREDGLWERAQKEIEQVIQGVVEGVRGSMLNAGDERLRIYLSVFMPQEKAFMASRAVRSRGYDVHVKVESIY